MWAVCLAACCLTFWLYNRALIIPLLPGTPQTNSHTRLIKSSIENVFVERKEIFRAETLLQTIHGPLFSQRELRSLQPRLCLCLLAYKWVNLFPTGFFPPLFLSVSCEAVVDFYTAVSWQSNRGPAIKILKASRISYLTFYNTNEASLSLRSGGVSLEKVAFLVCWQLSTPLMIHVFQMVVFEDCDEVNIISVPKFAWQEKMVCLLMNHFEPLAV